MRRLVSSFNLMSSLTSASKRLALLWVVLSVPASVSGATAFSRQGGEYPLIGLFAGDQVFPRVAINAAGGYVVWHDNNTDGNGLGIAARRLNSSLSGSLATFRVNETAIGDQEFPQVTMLPNGGAVFVWQGGAGAAQRIYARFLRPDGTYATGDVMVNTFQQQHQIGPAVASLSDGNVIVVWSSFGQDGSLYGVFGQRFSAEGGKLGGEFQINQSTANNQRTPAVVGLPNGSFLVVWISEKNRTTVTSTGQDGAREPDGSDILTVYDVDVYGRYFGNEGNPLQNEIRLNSSATICANPAISANSDGGFLVAWSGKPNRVALGMTNRPPDGWDIFARAFSANGTPSGEDFRVNPFTFGDQYLPNVASVADNYMVVWTTLGQDGSREGVAAQVLGSDGTRIGDEIHVNATTASQQIYPSVASDHSQRFLVVWSSFVGGAASFDLFAQRLSQSQMLVPPPPPYVSALSQAKLSITWPEVAGYPVAQYEVYMDGNPTPASVSGNMWTATGLAPGSSHSFKLAYRLNDGTRSPLSEAAVGQTWGEDENFDGLPDDWQTRYWGTDSGNWGRANVDTDGDGANNLQEFLAGTNPADPASVLRTTILPTAQGYRLSWNSQPGLIYEVQVSEDLHTWISAGLPRFALSGFDSIGLAPSENSAMYRIIRLR